MCPRSNNFANNSFCKLLSMCTLDLAAVGFQFDFLVSPPQLTNHICSCNQQCKSSHKPGSVPSAKSWKPSKKRGEKWEFVESDWDVKSRSVCASLAFIRPPMAPLTAYGTLAYGTNCGSVHMRCDSRWQSACARVLFSACFGTPLAITHDAIGLGVEGGVLGYPSTLVSFSCDTNPTRPT